MPKPSIAPLVDWFAGRQWKAFPFQRETWRAYLAGKSGLVHAPTGIGKTLAVWGGPILEGAGGMVKPVRGSAPFTVLWITPLRALATDTLLSLKEPADGLGLPWTVEIRTGDTSQTQKAKQKARLPTVLITTPESLSLFLTYEESRARMKSLRCVVIDEWHELLGNKRGAQTELCLARLRTWIPGLRVWGLSATIGNLDEAKNVLLGDEADQGVIVTGRQAKKVEIETLIPEEMERFPWSGHLGIRMVDQVVEQIEKARTTLLFTNTRSQTEIWFQALADARPEWGETLAMHHGSLEKKIRNEVEARLAEGTVKCVVCTASLDLGVDFTPVEQVMQVGSPKGVARLMQRAGRSGHRPGATSRVIGVPTNAFELVEFAAARSAVGARRIEARVPIELPLDVLVQHLVTVAIGGGFREEAMLEEVRRAWAFRKLGDLEWAWALEFVTKGGPALHAYEDFRKVELGADGVYRVEVPRIAQLHRMNIGTITSSPAVGVRFGNGRRLGTVEERFISKMKKGDQFVFAGRRLELVRFRDFVATVKNPTKKKGKRVPQWHGGTSPLSTQLGDAVAAKLREERMREPEMKAAADMLELQRAWSCVPNEGELLIEYTRTREGHHAFVYPFSGRLVHEGLAALCAFRITKFRERTIVLSFNDYGFELSSGEDLGMDEEQWREVFRTDTLLPDLLECMNVVELSRRQFREIARVAGLVIEGYPGRQKSLRMLQASSGLLFDVFEKYDGDNLLLAQAQREILDRQLEITRLERTLERIAGCRLVQIHSARLTPLAFPLWAEQLRASQVTSESYTKRLARMLGELEADAAKKSAPELQPERVE